MTNAGKRKLIALLEGNSSCSRPPASLAAALKARVPHPLYAAPIAEERVIVGRNAVVPIVTSKHGTQPGMLLGHVPVTSTSTFLLQAGQLGSHLLPRSTASQLKRSCAAFRSHVEESEKLERLWLSLPSTLTVLAGKAPKLNQTGLLRMKLQAELRHPLP